MNRTIDFSPAKLVAALGLTLVVLAAATWLLLIAPKQTRNNSLSATIKDTQAQLVELQAHSHVDKAAAKQAVSQSLFAIRALPNVAGMPQIVLQLNRIANEEHLSLDSITPQPIVPYAGYTAIPMTITLTGDFLNVETFLQQLRAQVGVTTDGKVRATGRLYDVIDATIQVTPTAPKITATLVLDAFSYSAIADAGISSATTTTPAG
ncbi:MAG TPA: type 4a pilus biogenesis protein PilO [Gaiellaceae bacterium]|jgi:hypothetical protein